MQRFSLITGLFLFWLLTAVLPLTWHAGARAAPDEPVAIHLRSRTIHPAPTRDVHAGLEVMARSLEVRPRHLILQLSEPPDADLRQALRARGIELQGYLPHQAYVARVKAGLTAADLAGLPVRYLGALELRDKVATALYEGRVPDQARLGGGRLALYVELHRDVPLESGLAVLMREMGVRVLGRVRSLGGALVELEASAWGALAAREEVKWIEPASPQFTELNDGVRQVMGVGALRAAPLELQGEGVRVLVYDGGLICPDHPDFGGRITTGESGPTSSHATHVAGTLAGSGFGSHGLYSGMAPAAGIISYCYESCNPHCLYDNPQDLEENYTEGMTTLGADFASNSIGSNIAANGYDCEFEGDYENTARLVDAIACGSLGRPFASFWAVGNERQGAAPCGDAYFTTGIPATAKNNIVVGGTYSDTDSIASFSSFGPVDDGRMRPDVVAPGCEFAGDGGVTSTRNCLQYTVMCGTSMATPAVAGVAALMLERMRVQSVAPPLPATYKAILAASAIDLGNPGPDYRHGYGLVNAVGAIAVIDSGTVEEAEITHGEQWSRLIDVPAGMSRLRAALAWDDPPGEPLSSVSLVNDLDLRLIAPDQSEHRAYVLDPSAPGAPATRGANRRDPSELVEVTDPAPGLWTLQITGHNIPSGPQTFSIAVNAAPGTAGTGVPVTFDLPRSPRVSLAQNVPNPFNPSTTIRYRIVEDGRVSLRIYDATGRMVRVLVEGEGIAGSHTVRWNGRDDRGRAVAGGVYFYQLEQERWLRVRRMVLAR